MQKCVLALDLGTTSNRCIAFNKQGHIVAQAYKEFEQIFPQPAWVEHNPNTLWLSAFSVLHQVIELVGAENVDSIGITNQRETTVVWDAETSEPLCNAIVWQCRRTAQRCEELKAYASLIKEKTGLFLDPYFSATKLEWILNNIPNAKEKAAKGLLRFGTVDTWILWNLTHGKSHATDVSNASRTLLFNIHTLQFDEELLNLFNIPKSVLPQVQPTGHVFGYTDPQFFHRDIPITCLVGDQQAALFAHGGWQSNVVKNTYGTGLFVAASTGSSIPHTNRLINTIAWQLNTQVTYAVEGSIFMGGSIVQWLRDQLHLVQNSDETEALARQLNSNDDVYLVPAFTGLGAPYWDPHARGLIIGLTRGTTAAHIVRAGLESMAYQTRDVLEEMKALGLHPKALHVDGGATSNAWLMQFQADILDLPVVRSKVAQTTAFGAALLAGLHSQFWSQEDLGELSLKDLRFDPKMEKETRDLSLKKWKKAVERALQWAD